MLTRDDLIDIIAAALPSGGSAAVPPGPKGRPFLSEYDIKKRLTAGDKRLTIASNSILSPLALDWLTLRGIDVVRE